MINRRTAIGVALAALPLPAWAKRGGRARSGGFPAAAVGDPTLLSGYYLRFNSGTGSPQYGKLRHRPRAVAATFNPGDPSWPNEEIRNMPVAFHGWDLLTPYNEGIQRKQDRLEWLRFSLSRPATVGVIWQWGDPPLPTCLQSGWTLAGTCTVKRGSQSWPAQIYTRSYPAGDHWLCAVNTGTGITTARDVPMLIFGEADGSAPAGALLNANQTCPSSLHAVDHWSPQIDPVEWCYHRHEHGADPKLFHPSWDRPFGEPATAMGMVEPHVGYKTMVFDSRNPSDDAIYRWLLAPHIGTAGAGRICQRLHSYAVAIADPGTGDVLVDTYLVADFGPALHNDTQDVIDGAACPGLNPEIVATYGTARGKRKLPVDCAGCNPGYEPWIADFDGSVLPFVGTTNTNTADPMTRCTGFTNASVIGNPNSTGTGLFFQGSDFGFDFSTYSGPTGWFCTDPEGAAVIDCGQADAVRQFVSPAVVGRLIQTGTNRAENDDGFGRRWTVVENLPLGVNAQPSVREGSIRPCTGTNPCVVVDPN